MNINNEKNKKWKYCMFYVMYCTNNIYDRYAI